MSRKRDRFLLILGIALMCVVGYGSLQVATSSDRKSGDRVADSPPARYVDPTYGFSLLPDPRFPKTMPASTPLGGAGYTKAWVAEGSRDGYFGVTVIEQADAATEQELAATVRTVLSHPDAVAAWMGGNARILRLRAATIEGMPATIVDAYIDDAVSGRRLRTRWTTVLLPRDTYVLGGFSTPETWRRNIPSFEAMVASFRLPPHDL